MHPTLSRSFLLASLALGFVACSDDDDDPPPFEVTTIGASLDGLGLDTLDAAVTAAGFDDDLDEAGPLTLFAPTDEAFAALPDGTLDELLEPANQAQLVDLLSYHVLAVDLDSTAAQAQGTALALNGDALLFDTLAGEVYVNDARLIEADIVADNGRLHRIDRVLRPPTDLVTALGDRGLDEAVAAIESAGLTATLQGPGPFTLFAPSDAAFVAAEADLQGLTQQELAELLSYHLVPDTLGASAALEQGFAASSADTVVVFDEFEETWRINGVEVTTINVPCTNGILHVIDEVLLTPLDATALAAGLGYDTLSAALAAAELDDDVAEPNGPLTLFAPSDAAFEALPEGLLAELLLPENQNELEALLLYHLVALELDATALQGSAAVLTALNEDAIVDQVGGELYVNDGRVEPADVQATNGVLHGLDAVLRPPTDLLSTLADRGFETLSQALVDSGVDLTLAGPGPFTLLAPTDAAFAALPAGALEALAPQELADLLEYHLVSSFLRASEAATMGAVTSVQGADLTFAAVGEGITVNGVELASFNIPATNGVVHVIDSVLSIPAGTTLPVPGLAATRADAQPLAEALTAHWVELGEAGAGPAAAGAGAAGWRLLPGEGTGLRIDLPLDVVPSLVELELPAGSSGLRLGLTLGGWPLYLDPDARQVLPDGRERFRFAPRAAGQATDGLDLWFEPAPDTAPAPSGGARLRVELP
jgi:uncharacterized surface protein with fasciclin (FAS1) repeats